MKKVENGWSRRDFVKKSSAALAVVPMASFINKPGQIMTTDLPKYFRVASYNSTFEREKLAKAFGFKGSATHNLWQIATRLNSAEGETAIGLGVQNPLWCDARMAGKSSESGGNAIMYSMTERALQMIKGEQFASPMVMLDEILEELLDYGKKITGQADLRKTFALNPLVPIDNAAWLLYAKINGLTNFDELIPAQYKGGLSAKHKHVISIPALTYGTPIEDIKQLADTGFFIMKIKLGAPGDQRIMLEKDKAFLKAIHDAIGHYETEHSPNGKIPYYFDANGRYDRHDTLMEFLDYAEKIGALDQIAVLEEPFGERNQDDVRQIAARGPRVAADESAHTVEETLARIEQGYTAIAVKSIAKTMSMTMKIAQAAYENNVPCFCADLTVNPILVEWNKVVAARLPAFPGWNMGMQETNGWQNYKDWPGLIKQYHPMGDADWVMSKNGLYDTGEAFFKHSGGIFEEIPFWEERV
jgi:L-alanine-DL-glutamate epimerase-like enolase superfamily enzyme